jgi:ABC-2 type transport system permease protein
VILKLNASVKKEFLLLIRDRAGLAMLFIMPVALVLIMTLLQDSSFKMLEEKKLPVIILNHDNDVFGNDIVEGLTKSDFFEITKFAGNDTEGLKNEVAAGNYLIGIVIKKDATLSIRKNLNKDIYHQFPEEITEAVTLDTIGAGETAKVDVFFDPVLKSSFKLSILSALREFSSGVEAQIIYDTYASLFQELLGIEMNKPDKQKKLVEFNEQYASNLKQATVPNSVQHNVPAWTLFAMFFIVIPLAGNIISERTSGVSLRLKTMPGSVLPSLLGKVTVYFTIGILQAFLMLLIGVYLLPYLDLPKLNIGHQWLAILLLTMVVSAAASGYGILIGTIFSSQEQASIFGAISVVIMAAVGGIWVPTFMMTNLMQVISKISPLNWGLTGYYDILLRNAGIGDILQQLLLLAGFFITTIAGAYFFVKQNNK